MEYSGKNIQTTYNLFKPRVLKTHQNLMFLLADPEKAVLGLNTFKDLDVQYPDVSGILASAV
jgi:hypothetical protein